MNPQAYASQAQETFVLPDAVFRIKQLIDDETADMQDIASVVNFDPALTAQLLKVANSALYKFPNKIDTISKAIQVIGTNSVYDLVVAYGVAKAFDDVDKAVIDLDRFWEQSVCCALLCKYFADKMGIREAERLFVAGLLHNIGELVTVHFNPELARKCAQFNENITPLMLQEAHLSTTYAEIGSALIHMWGIPASIANPIGRQHFEKSPAVTLDDKIMQLSYVLALDNVNAEYYGHQENLESILYERLSLDVNDLSMALEHTNLQALSVLTLFNPGAMAGY